MGLQKLPLTLLTLLANLGHHPLLGAHLRNTFSGGDQPPADVYRPAPSAHGGCGPGVYGSDGQRPGWPDQRNQDTGGDTGEEESKSLQEELSETSEKA